MKYNLRYSSITNSNVEGTEKKNQDASIILSDKENGMSLLAAVCDGVGSLENSEIASNFTVKMLGTFFEEEKGSLKNLEQSDILSLVHNKVSNVNSVIYEMGKERNLKLATTMSMLLISNLRWLIANVGDSRIYTFSDGKLTKVTKDQTVAQKMYDAKKCSTEYLENSKDAKTLTQAVGYQKNVAPDYYEGEIKGDTYFLIGSDGMFNTLKEDELKYLLNEDLGTKDKLEKLVYMARKRAEKDNITGILIKVEKAV